MGMWLYVILTVLFWGTAPLFERLYTRSISIVTIYMMFFVLGLSIIPFVIAVYHRTILQEFPTLFTTRKDILVYGFAGLFVTILAFVCYLKSIQLSNDRAHLVVALTCVYPIVTAFLLWTLVKVPIQPLEWLGIGLIVVGTSVLVARG